MPNNIQFIQRLQTDIDEILLCLTGCIVLSTIIKTINQGLLLFRNTNPYLNNCFFTFYTFIRRMCKILRY